MYEGKLDDFSQSGLTAANKIAGIKDDEVQSRLTEVLTGEKVITVAEGLIISIKKPEPCLGLIVRMALIQLMAEILKRAVQ